MIPTLVVDALAAYRLTRLVTADTLLARPRDAVVRWSYGRQDRRHLTLTTPNTDEPHVGDWAEMAIADEADAPKLANLVTCRWCTGVWVAAGVVAARRLAPRWWGPVADLLAVASGAALVAGLEQ